MSRDFVSVAIRVKKYKQLFDSRDPAPFLERDLDDDAVDYIVGSVEEQPSDAPIHVALHISEPFGDEITEEEIRVSIHTYFDFQAEGGTRKLRELLRLGQVYLLAGITFLTVCLVIAQLLRSLIHGQSALLQVAPEGFTIMGWVAMWRPIEFFLYDWWPIIRRRAIFRRLALAKVSFVQGD